MTQPENTQPATTQPESTQPATTQPENTQPATTQPTTTQPASADPEQPPAGRAQASPAQPGQPDPARHYQAPGWFTRHVFNNAVAGLTRVGISVWGSRILETKGRKTGQPRRTPVNLLTWDGHHYLVAPRGHTAWVANVRADDGHLTLILGRKRGARHARELSDEEKVPVLRAYLKRWKAEVGVFFEGVGPDSPDADLARIAPRHPVFILD